MNDPIVITAIARTPIGNFQGFLKTFTAPQLGAIAVEACLNRSQLPATSVSEVIMGCVLPAGLGQAPARQATLLAGLPQTVGALTINKVCGSGMKAVMLACDLVAAGSYTVGIAGGMESMSNAPYLLPKARQGYRIGHYQVLDHLSFDGLEDAFANKGKSMGYFAENCAQHYNFTREQQDQFALTSLERAQKATLTGLYQEEIVPIKYQDKGKEMLLVQDEGPLTAKPEKIPLLKPAFAPNGTVTAANASSISDGAAALVITRRSIAEKNHFPLLATIIAHATYAQAPEWFTTAPIGAIKNLLEKTGWDINDVDLFEINEAFAVVVMATLQELGIPHEKVNVHGGACVLGHPIGASGARILVTLISALRQHQMKRGIAAICLGGGEALAVAIEI